MTRPLTRQRAFHWGSCVLVLLLAVGLVAAPTATVEAARDGVDVCLRVILPSLFPFFILSGLLTALGLADALGSLLRPLMGPVFALPGSAGCALALGLVGGYPVGARTAVSLYQDGSLTKEEAQRLLGFCNNCGPAFFLGVVGVSVFQSETAGWILYGVHVLAALLLGLLFRLRVRRRGEISSRSTPIHTARLSQALPQAVGGAVRSLVNVCAFVVFFSIVIALLRHFQVLPALAGLLSHLGLSQGAGESFLTGLLELSAGVLEVGAWTSGAFPARLALCAFLMGWAGLSVHFQVLTLLKDTDLSPKSYFLGKLLHGALSALLALLACALWSPALSAIAVLPPPFLPMPDYMRIVTASIKLYGVATVLLLLPILISSIKKHWKKRR